MKKFSEDLLAQCPLVGVLRGYSQEDINKIVEILIQESFTTIEITMNTPNAISIIKSLVSKYGGQLNIGAGTVLSIEEANEVIAVGGQFIVSPIVDLDLIRHCKSQSIPVFPGAYSPTEIYQAWQAGARMVKVFPARNLGPNYIKDVLAPLDGLEIMPTGGVNMDNAEAYFKAGVKALGMGGYLFNKNLIKNKDWHGLAAHFKLFKEAVDRARLNHLTKE